MRSRRGAADTWIALGAGLAALGVAAGAFGAHGLKKVLTPADLAIFETGVRYQMFHALGLILLGLVARGSPGRKLEWASRLLAVGTLIFSGSLYFLVLTGPRWLGAITPIGGTALIAGWCVAAAAVAVDSPRE